MSSTKAAVIRECRPGLTAYEAVYKKIHANPELSHCESETASLIIQHLRGLSADFEIRAGIGGHGLIAILHNGSGKTVLLRADIDALPVAERTGLEYASLRRQIGRDGKETPVMHACGHDFHAVCLLIAAETLLRARQCWTGTLVFLFQPAEEAGDGALGMVNDGLYDSSRHNCPIPDIVLGQHVAPIRAGVVASKTGPIMSSSDSLKVTIFGRGGHGSMPHRCIDPVVIASHIVVRLQTIVSRVVPPDEVAVITVGSIHAGEAENVISDRAFFTVNIRTLDEEVRHTVLDHVQRTIKSECEAGFCEKAPQIEHHMSLPVTANSENTETKLRQTFAQIFGPDFVVAPKSSLASEDFSILAGSIGKPYCFWLFGGIDQQLWDSLAAQGKLDTVPINHSPDFAPAIHPTLQTGGDALVAAALTFLESSQ
ncbi:hypothetical protein AYO20_09705 [Fonsecaea nubica]|uniref:Peptidase M20 dimerisation domain-containing protein n=1 Tax=Fonsecaea nubica TaxID=856822 RepID=A0A178CF31_9EURO|nr:hypothetical protein AYO20_09705 [Fonsecaea nubica]OAL27632.1 hypothetical protein AYO20_09705 [Fonsecaea nubica]